MTWSLSIVYHLWARISNFIFKLSYSFAWVKKRLQNYEKNINVLNSHWLPTLILSSFRSSLETRLWVIATSVLGVLTGKREWGLSLFPWEQYELCSGQFKTDDEDTVMSHIILININFCDSREVSLSSLQVRICRCLCMLLCTFPMHVPDAHTPTHVSLCICPYAHILTLMPPCTHPYAHVPVYMPLCTWSYEHPPVNMPLCTHLCEDAPRYTSLWRCPYAHISMNMPHVHAPVSKKLFQVFSFSILFLISLFTMCKSSYL